MSSAATIAIPAKRFWVRDRIKVMIAVPPSGDSGRAGILRILWN
jgi:hypothetical protein